MPINPKPEHARVGQMESGVSLEQGHPESFGARNDYEEIMMVREGGHSCQQVSNEQAVSDPFVA